MRKHLAQLPCVVCVVTALVIAPSAFSADKDAAYYKRTGTAPPGEFLIGPKLLYADQIGVGLNFGYEWKDGPVLLFDVSALRIDAVSGTVPFRCYEVPYSVPSRTTAQIGVSILFKPKPKR